MKIPNIEGLIAALRDHSPHEPDHLRRLRADAIIRRGDEAEIAAALIGRPIPPSDPDGLVEELMRTRGLNITEARIEADVLRRHGDGAAIAACMRDAGAVRDMQLPLAGVKGGR